jgi:hypothetical protein
MTSTEERDKLGVSYKSKWIQAEMILNAVGSALDGEHDMISDFEMSFPIVRQACDLWIRANATGD